jgi:trigger factor
MLEASEFQTLLEAQYKLAQSKAHLKGFRKGKAPIQVIKRVLGHDIQTQVVEELTDGYFNQIAIEKNIKILGQARIRHFDLKENEKLSIYLIYQVQPDFELTPFDGYEFKKSEYEVTDEDVALELKMILRNQGALASIEGEAGEEDFVIADVQKLDESGMAIIGERQENQTFGLENIPKDSPFYKALIGTKAGDERRVEVEAKQADSTEMTRYQLTVKEVKQLELPELSDEMAKELTQGKLNTADELRADIRKQLGAHFNQKAEEDLLESIAQKFVEDNMVPVPKMLTDSFENMLVENARRQIGGKFPAGFNESMFRKEIRPSAERHARWMIIRNKISELNDISVTDDDIKTFAEAEAQKAGETLTDEVLKSYMSNEVKPYILDTMLRDKVYGFIKEKCKIEIEKKPLPKPGQQN